VTQRLYIHDNPLIRRLKIFIVVAIDTESGTWKSIGRDADAGNLTYATTMSRWRKTQVDSNQQHTGF